MSGELQTIPARHGVATFVPRGGTIKIINTYGKQVVSTWAFALHKPPEKEKEDGGDDGERDREIVGQQESAKKDAPEKTGKKGKPKNKNMGDSKEDAQKVEVEVQKPKEDAEKTVDDPPEQELPQSAAKENDPSDPKKEAGAEAKQANKKTWSSYLPSLPYRSKGTNKKPDAESEKAENEANSRKWSSYIPTGKGFSSYVPNVQIPDSKGVASAFKASHYRDPNKSYAEQLYDFSKTPVGAGTLAAATGSGTASSLYAAYNAYSKLAPALGEHAPMECLSVAHTRASSRRLSPAVRDTLLTNLRNPIMTLVEDTTPGGHDTLTAACDASLYAAIGVDKPEEHGSCAENLVLALKELNEKAGLKGNKAVGADVTVNFAPTPLHLFMNTPIDVDVSTREEGAGCRGVSFRVEEPKGKKRGHVRFKAERDLVVVMSACPMDVGKQNGGKCMAANFLVEVAGEDSSGPPPDRSAQQEGSKPMPKPKGGPAKFANMPKPSQPQHEKGLEQENVGASEGTSKDTETSADGDNAKNDNAPKRKKPKKLERRGRDTSTPSNK